MTSVSATAMTVMRRRTATRLDVAAVCTVGLQTRPQPLVSSIYTPQPVFCV